MPRISVVVPVYNAEKYIADTLDSIARQSFRDFEAHIIDDFSTDGSATIIQRFCEQDPRFVYHRSPSNFGGPAGPRNLGIEAASGEFVAFCDADDIWVPHKLEIQIRVAEESGAAVVSTIIRDFPDGQSLPELGAPSPPFPVHLVTHGDLMIKNRVAMSSAMVKRSIFDAIGPFNTARSHVAVEDYDMWLRIAGAGHPIIRVNAPMVHYRKLAASLSSKKMQHVRKALNMIGEDYARRGRAGLFRLMRPLHWMLYVGTSAWTRAVRGEL